MSSCTKEKLYSYSALQRSALSNLSVCQRSSFTIMTGSKPEGAGEIDTGRQWSEGADLISTLDPRTFVRRDNALCIRQSSEATFSLQVAMQLDPEAVLRTVRRGAKKSGRRKKPNRALRAFHRKAIAGLLRKRVVLAKPCQRRNSEQARTRRRAAQSRPEDELPGRRSPIAEQSIISFFVPSEDRRVELRSTFHQGALLLQRSLLDRSMLASILWIEATCESKGFSMTL